MDRHGCAVEDVQASVHAANMGRCAMDTPGRADTGDGEAQEPSGSGQASFDAAAAAGLEKSMASPPPP